MNKRKVLVLGSVLFCTLFVVGAALAGIGNNYGVEWNVIAGGGQRSVGSSYAVQGTAGQPVIGPATGSTYGVQSGFWYGVNVSREHRIYLPLTVRNQS